MTRIYLVATEPSGDALAADVIDAIYCRYSNVEFVGVGGAMMAERGVQSLYDISDLSILGLIEGIKAYSLVKERVEQTAQDIIEKSPDAVVLIDSWGFMWRVAQRMKELGSDAARIKLIGPQVWATRPGRAKTLAAHVDHLLCIHSFEQPFYEPYGLPTTVIGNPAVSRVSKGDRAAFRQRYGLGDNEKLLLLLPGSRASEIKRVLPTLEKAAERVCQQDETVKVVCVAAPSVKDQVITKAANWSFPHFICSEGKDKTDAFAAADAALACSGTVTTEVALQGTPLVVGYKLGWITWAIARGFLMKSKYISLLNVAADAEVMPEYVQTRFTASNLASDVLDLLNNEGRRNSQIALQEDALDTMGRGLAPAAEIAADTILKLASEKDA